MLKSSTQTERLSPYKDGGLVAEMRAVTIKALEKFWCITQMPMDEDNKKIVSSFSSHEIDSREIYHI
jgi:hypothetical protein